MQNNNEMNWELQNHDASVSPHLKLCGATFQNLGLHFAPFKT